MSYLAIGATTQAIVELLTRKLNKPALLGSTASFTVSTLPPDDDRVGENTGLNLYLYRITESAFLKNFDWPGDRNNPAGGGKPALAVTLNYLLTAYTKKVANSFQDDITAHQLLGNAMSILHDNPVLNDVHDGDFDSDLDTNFAPELRDAFDKIKVTLLPTSMDEFSKIWTGLGKAYRLSMAYEVSLVQIAPLTARTAPKPPPQVALLGINTLGTPMLVTVEPSSGPAGSSITLRGSGFAMPGATTRVFVGGVTFEQESLDLVAGDTIQLTLPDALIGGPNVAIAVECQGRQSSPVGFRVEPWIQSLVPLRGTTGIPLRFSCDTAPASVTLDGVAAASTYDAATKTVEVVVPAAIATNGPKAVVAAIPGPRRSNALTFELLPRVTGVTVISGGVPVTTTLTVQGDRLAGSDVRVQYGELLLSKGENLDPAQVQIVLDRPLASDSPVSVLVDGHQSETFPPGLDRIDPSTAPAGEWVTLLGHGLSGTSVVVHFGTTSQDLGAQPFARAVRVTVPGSLSPGSVDVSVTVDGVDTGSASLTVSA